MRQGKMRIERGAVGIHLVQEHVLRLSWIGGDIKLQAACFLLPRGLRVFNHQRHERLDIVCINLKCHRDNIHSQTAFTYVYINSCNRAKTNKRADATMMNRVSPLKVACIGAGYFAQFHYGSWERMEDVRLVGACDQDLARAKATGLTAFTDPEAMITQCQPDLVDVILPPKAHAETIAVLLGAGVKWIICQKPFCQDIEEAKATIQLANQHGATIIVHENFRFQPWFRTIKTALSKGQIGQVLQATFRLRPGDGQGPDAYLARQPYFQKMQRFLVHETGVHYIDTFRYLLGEATAVYADTRKVNPVIAGEDACHVLFDHDDGVRALLDANRNLDHAADNTRCTMGEALIEGTEGTLTLTGDGAVHLRNFGATDQVQLLAPSTWDGFGGDCVHALQSHVVSHILSGTELENAAPNYLRVLEIEDAIYRSATEGRKVGLDGT